MEDGKVSGHEVAERELEEKAPEMRPLWCKEACGECGAEGYATRTEAKPKSEPYICGECRTAARYDSDRQAELARIAEALGCPVTIDAIVSAAKSALAAIAAIREHCGGGYEAAAREIEAHAAAVGSSAAHAHCARIIREHAQPAAQAPAVQWYAYDPEDGFCEYDSAEDAESAAETALEYAREKSGDGWPEWVDGIHWGHFVAHATACQTSCEPAPDGSDFDEICDYGLVTQHSEGAAAPASGPEDVDVRTVAREPVAVTDAMVEAAIEAWHERSPALLDEQMRHVLRAALAAAPQRVREAGEAEAERVLRIYDAEDNNLGCYTNEEVGECIDTMLDALRAVGLSVAAPDAEWTALVEERDGLREELDGLRLEYAGTLDNHADERATLREQLAAATKRAVDAEARVRELEARPVVVRDEACRNAVEQVANWIDGHISRGDLSDAIRRALEGRS